MAQRGAPATWPGRSVCPSKLSRRREVTMSRDDSSPVLRAGGPTATRGPDGTMEPVAAGSGRLRVDQPLPDVVRLWAITATTVTTKPITRRSDVLSIAYPP